jgi:hypothetical protein
MGETKYYVELWGTGGLLGCEGFDELFAAQEYASTLMLAAQPGDVVKLLEIEDVH